MGKCILIVSDRLVVNFITANVINHKLLILWAHILKVMNSILIAALYAKNPFLIYVRQVHLMDNKIARDRKCSTSLCLSQTEFAVW